MAKKTYYIPFFFLVLSLTGCKPPALENFNSFHAAAPKPSYGESLVRGYSLLAEYEQFYVRNDTVAAHFRLKAQQAKNAVPDNPDSTGLLGNEAKEIKAAYGMLLRTLTNPDHVGSGMDLAEAQINFDCWLNRLSEEQKIGGLQTAQWCRERFYAAIEKLEHIGPKYFAIYFDNNAAIPDAAAFTIIRQAAAAFSDHENDDWRVRLTGHSDPTGTPEQNMVLSMRRALAVRNALAQNGVDPGKVSIAAAGTKGKSNDTNDNENYRRVDIAIIPPSMDRPEKGEPDITKILPQYFGPEGLNF